jgi:hypothetical protein
MALPIAAAASIRPRYTRVGGLQPWTTREPWFLAASLGQKLILIREAKIAVAQRIISLQDMHSRSKALGFLPGTNPRLGGLEDDLKAR